MSRRRDTVAAERLTSSQLLRFSAVEVAALMMMFGFGCGLLVLVIVH